MAKGEYKNKTYSLRLPNDLREKLEVIAETECRPFSKQIELAVKFYLAEYENQHGKIEIKHAQINGDNGTINM